MKDFISIVLSNCSQFLNISLLHNDISRIENHVKNALGHSNAKELRDRFEGLSFLNNFLIKITGVKALEKLIKIDLVNLIDINPKDYDPIVIIKGEKLRVITSDYGELPVINKKYKMPIVFCVRRDKKNIWICGFADKKILNHNQNDSYIKGEMLKSKSDKTCFTGFNKLMIFNSEQELITLIKQSL